MKLRENISCRHFINSLSFDYVETYSFQRGKEYLVKLKQQKLEYQNIISTQKDNNLTAFQEKKLSELQKLLFARQYILNDENKIHPSAKKTNTFEYKDPSLIKFIEIFQIENIDVPDYRCAPIYRDAIIFYNKEHKIIASINICLECQYIENEPLSYLNADCKVYEHLTLFFRDIGHDVKTIF